MLIFLITVFVFAIGLLVFSFIIPEIMGGMETAGMNSTPEAQGAIDEVVEFGVNGLQKGFLFLFVGLIMATMITSFLVRTHPMFIILYIFFLGITLFIGTYIGNAYEQVASTTALADSLASQGLITSVMQNIVGITLVVGALSILIVFAKFTSFFSRAPQGGGL